MARHNPEHEVFVYFRVFFLFLFFVPSTYEPEEMVRRMTEMKSWQTGEAYERAITAVYRILHPKIVATFCMYRIFQVFGYAGSKNEI